MTVEFSFYEIMITEIKSSFNTTGHFLCDGDESRESPSEILVLAKREQQQLCNICLPV